jgi:aldehyde dehydrogenase family 7 protein A1
MVLILQQQKQFAVRLFSAFFNHQQNRMASLLIQNKTKYGFLSELGLQEENQGVFDGQEWKGSGPVVESLSPSNNEVIARVWTGTPTDYERVAYATKKAFRDWAALPAPNRGEIVRQIGDQLRKNLDNLGALVSH